MSVTSIVLMYHNIASGRQNIVFREWQPAYDVAAEDFQTHLGLIEKHKAPVHVTFDDGYHSVLPWVETLQQHRIPATCFVTTSTVGQRGMLQTAEIRALAQAGIRIGSHSHSHIFLQNLTPLQQQTEILTPRKILSDIIGQDVTTMSLPGGRYDNGTLQYAGDCGYHEIYTSTPGVRPRRLRHAPNLILVPRWVITQNVLLPEFETILRAETWHLIKKRSRYFAGRLGKRFLGNQNYHMLWNKLHHLKTSSLAERDT